MLLFINLWSIKLWAGRMFQYISCYSLSEQQPEKVWRQECFNTSHVTLYHKGQKVYSSWSGGFNTSHVTLYRQLAAQLHKFLLVSIHLMLLFIDWIICRELSSPRFQYISCYSLSPWNFPGLLLPLVSIHLMLLFIWVFL